MQLSQRQAQLVVHWIRVRRLDRRHARPGHRHSGAGPDRGCQPCCWTSVLTSGVGICGGVYNLSAAKCPHRQSNSLPVSCSKCCSSVWHRTSSPHATLATQRHLVPQTISARRWKMDMGLNGKGKDGSRELAVQLFPQSADMLKCARALVCRGIDGPGPL